MKKKKLIPIILVIVIVSFVALGLAFGKNDSNDAIYVETALAKVEDVTSYVSTSGMVSSKASYNLSPKSTGEVVELLAHEGDAVKKDQVLLRMNAKSVQNQIAESEIQLEIAKETLLQIVNKGTNNYKTSYKNAVITKDNALKAYKDAKKLYEAGVGSKSAMDQALTTYQQAMNSYEDARANYNNENANSDIKIQELRIQSLENSLANLKQQLEDLEIKSPIDGVITVEKVKLLSTISPSAAVYSVEDLDQLKVTINVSQYDIHRIQLGQHVTIKADGIDKSEFEGTISKIGSKAISKAVGASQEMVIEVEIDVVSKNTPLRPNYSVKTKIETAHEEGAIVLPYEAVYVNKAGEKIIFTVKDGKVTKHIIERGVEGVFNFQVISDSIAEGDHVILNPNENITEDVTVVERSVQE